MIATVVRRGHDIGQVREMMQDMESGIWLICL